MRLLALALLATSLYAADCAGDPGCYTLAYIPDAQAVHSYSTLATYITTRKAAWNVKGVLSGGDLVNDGSSAGAYTNAIAAYKALATAGIPAYPIPGNHDYNSGGAGAPLTTRVLPATTWNNGNAGDAGYFAPDHRTDTHWDYGTDGANVIYELVISPTRKLLIVALEFFPRSAVMDWAQTIVLAHQTTHEVILPTHAYLIDNGQMYTTGTANDPASYGFAGPPASNHAVQMWSWLTNWPNLRMVWSGHYIAASWHDPGVGGISVTPYYWNGKLTANASGKTVHQFYNNYQDIDMGSVQVPSSLFTTADFDHVTFIKFPSAGGYELYDWSTATGVADKGVATPMYTNGAYEHIDVSAPSSNGLFPMPSPVGSGLPPTGGTAGISTVSNTQALVSYVAPGNGPCTVEVSESPTYLPLVNDVDGAKFAGAASDNRAGSLGAGTTARTVVVGKRTIDTAADANNYSRALQASTKYYWRACGNITGTFTTSNIPFNSTYQDIPQVNPDSSTAMPTFSATDRTQQIVDARTGALIRRVSLPADDGAASGPFLYSGGMVRVCSNSLMGAPAIGFLCAFPDGDGGQGTLYYIIPSTGESRFLGKVAGRTTPLLDPTDGNMYIVENDQVDKLTYTGNYSAAIPDAAASISTVVLATGLKAKIHAFNPAFVEADFGCAGRTRFGRYIPIACIRGGQDSYGWAVIFDTNTNQVIAAAQTYQNIKTRWTLIHAWFLLYDQPILAINTHDSNEYGIGAGPYIVHTTAALSTSDTTVLVDGEPACAFCGADSSLPPAQVGDVFIFSGAEKVQITAKVSPTQWTVTRGYGGTTPETHISGAQANALGIYSVMFWKFLADPNGTDTTNTSYIHDPNWSFGGHDDAAPGIMVTENTGWDVRLGDLNSQPGQVVTRKVNSGPTFAGATAQCLGNGCAAHPSAFPDGSQPWITDFFHMDGSNLFFQDPGMVPISGQLYRYMLAPSFPLNRKHFATATTAGAAWNSTGPHGFVDISGPGSVIQDTSADIYRYCVVNVAGECHTREAGATSQVGDVFVNLTGTWGGEFTCGAGGICIGNFGAFADGVVQSATASITQTRVISASGLSRLHEGSDYPNAKALADGSYLLFANGSYKFPAGSSSHVLMAKLPPFTVDDAVDRTTFIRAPIAITTPQGQDIATATVEFGYAEQGLPSDYYCTSRRESCVVVASTVTDATPFWFKSTDAYTRAPCAASCTITLPVLPGHVAYWRVSFYNGAGAFIQYGNSGVAIEGLVKP